MKDGIRAAWPICLGYIPIGLAFGVLAQKAGLSAAAVGLMSALVFAGSAQFIAVAMLGTGAGTAAIVATTFAVNLRHLLMSSALSVPLKGLRKRWLTLFAYGVTDESFAVNLARFREGGWDWKRALTVNHVTNAVWVMSTVAGALGGALIPAHAFGIDYALMGMFLCLLVYQLRGRMYVLTAVIAGTSAVAAAGAAARVEALGGREYASRRTAELVRQASLALAPLPGTPARDALTGFAEYVTRRES